MSTQLKQLDENIWTAQSSHNFLGCDFGGRMTVIRLSSNNLLLHSPVQLDKNLVSELDKIGIVKYLVAPNKFHHIYIGNYLSVYSDAELWASPGLPKKRRDINFNGELGTDAPSEWIGDLEFVLFDGVPFLNEVVFYHPSSRTVIFTDLILIFQMMNPPGVKIFAWLDGIYKAPDVPRLIRWFMLHDREKARESARKILSWDFDRVSVTHKTLIETGGKKIVSRAFESI